MIADFIFESQNFFCIKSASLTRESTLEYELTLVDITNPMRSTHQTPSVKIDALCKLVYDCSRLSIIVKCTEFQLLPLYSELNNTIIFNKQHIDVFTIRVLRL